MRLHLVSGGCALPVPPLEQLSGGALVVGPARYAPGMEWLSELYWTPAWTTAATLFLAPSIGLAGVSLTLRSQRKTFALELQEKRNDALREALVEVLSHRSDWTGTIAKFRNFEVDRRDVGLDIRDVEEDHDQIRSEAQKSTAELHVRCTRVELLTRDRELLIPIAHLRRAAERLSHDPVANEDAWEKANTSYGNLADGAKQSLAVHGLDRPLVTDSDRWRIRRREYKRAFKAGEATVYVPPLWKHLWNKTRKEPAATQPRQVESKNNPDPG